MLKGDKNMDQIHKNMRCCVTCAYWLGNRNPNRLGYVEASSRMDKGRCGAVALNDTRQYQAIYCCGRYCKWQVLK